MVLLLFGAACVACVLGLALGMMGLFAPSVAAKIVRLQADPAFPEGAAEFRASFGGLFVAVHAGALGFFALDAQGGFGPLISVVAFAMAGLLWLGTALGRTWALIVDGRTRTAYQGGAVIFETLVGLALFAPLLGWLTVS